MIGAFLLNIFNKFIVRIGSFVYKIQLKKNY